ncbi:MAG: fatty acid desaturase, partial [Rhodospirillaceae bacterium]
ILARSLRQLADSFLPLIAVCAAMYLSLGWSTWATLALAVLAAGFVVRIFIIQHDCGHGSFFHSRRANDVVGMLCSLVTLTPYRNWRRQHAGHHGIWNNLDRRHSGADIYSTCLTTAEYEALPRWRRRRYRASRHPIVSLILLPPLVFLLLYRAPFDTPRSWRTERRSVHFTNLALIAVYGALGWALGVPEVLLVQLPISIISAVFGVWLFSLQHRFETTLWARQDAWNVIAAALRGSSFLRLPRVLQWFTGNIGYHHVHHLNARVPNYRLQECHEAIPALRSVPVLTLGRSLRNFRFVLWDEARQMMVPFPAAPRDARAAAKAG